MSKKGTARKLLSLKNRQDRFISTYVQSVRPDLYNEAKTYYEELRLRYPGKRDMCKTSEFLRKTKGFDSFEEYYLERAKQKRREGQTTERKLNQTTRTGIVDNMVLNIPLMTNEATKDPSETGDHTRTGIVDNRGLNIPLMTNEATKDPSETGDHELPLVISDDIYEDLLAELRNDPDLYNILNDFDVDLYQEEVQVIQEKQDTIPNHQCQQDQANTTTSHDEIISELSKDPILYDIINNMDIEQTPLEKELTTLGY